MARDCPNPGAPISSVIVLRGIWSECSRLQFAWNSIAGTFAWNSILVALGIRERGRRRSDEVEECAIVSGLRWQLFDQHQSLFSISRFGFIQSKSWWRIQNWFYTLQSKTQKFILLFVDHIKIWNLHVSFVLWALNSSSNNLLDSTFVMAATSL